MDGQRFDQITRSFASGVSRRNALKGLFGLAGGSALASMTGGSSLAEPGKTAICHFPPENPGNVQVIEVANPALPDHFAHGDFAFNGCCTDADCDSDESCIDGTCCTLQCDGLTCGTDDGCGGTCDCEGGRVCLSNGSCAIPCQTSSQCDDLDLGCHAGCGSSGSDDGNILVCIATSGGPEPCFFSNAECPVGSACIVGCGVLC